jgi:NADH-quinone oxidoreductase subunit F
LDPKQRIILRTEGLASPRALRTYVEQAEGYTAVKKALGGMKKEQVIEEVKASGLRGRGGAGFPTGLKWSFVPKDLPGPKYLICNNDESEPGTFKDRHLCSVNPHQLIEGMVIAGYAIGASKGYIYTRWEFQEEIGFLEAAIKEAYAAGFLGKNLFGSGFDFDLDHYTGAGAYICGEEMGLISSLEGKKGQPRPKPPFPAVAGYLMRPTIVNNTETLTNVPWIINHGAKAFRASGTEKSPGTKLFSVSGAINKPGVYEVPLAYPWEKFLADECGGMQAGRTIKAVIPGGASAPVLTPKELEGLTLDYEAMAARQSMLGSGAIMIIDDRQSIAELLAVTIEFFAHESCGQCTPCREGTGWLNNIMGGIMEHKVKDDSVDRLLTIAKFMGGKTICALSDACAMPVTGFVSKFRDELVAHLVAGSPTASGDYQKGGK